MSTTVKSEKDLVPSAKGASCVQGGQVSSLQEPPYPQEAPKLRPVSARTQAESAQGDPTEKRGCKPDLIHLFALDQLEFDDHQDAEAWLGWNLWAEGLHLPQEPGESLLCAAGNVAAIAACLTTDTASACAVIQARRTDDHPPAHSKEIASTFLRNSILGQAAQVHAYPLAPEEGGSCLFPRGARPQRALILAAMTNYAEWLAALAATALICQEVRTVEMIMLEPPGDFLAPSTYSCFRLLRTLIFSHDLRVQEIALPQLSAAAPQGFTHAPRAAHLLAAAQAWMCPPARVSVTEHSTPAPAIAPVSLVDHG